MQAATQLFTWGYNFGTAPPDATNIVAMAGGDGHIVALRADGKVIAWGQNDYGQANVPPDVTNAVSISAGSTHSLALLNDGTVRFWGNIYTTGVSNAPLLGVSNMVVLAAGGTAQHVLSARSDGAAVDWGNAFYGLSSVPGSAADVIAASAASYHALALRADGIPVAWGLWGTTFPNGNPVVPAGATNIVAVSSGFSHDLALRSDGSLIGWGQTASEAITPPQATNIIAIASGGSQRLALRGDGQLLAWYSGGQMIAVPSGLSNIVAIAATTSGNLALSASDGPPLLGTIPHNLPIVEGTTFRLRALAISTTPLSYQWMCYGTNLPGATNAMLVLSNAQPGQSGIYTVVVSNAFGTVTNSDLTLNVVPLLIQVPPQNQTVAAGTTAAFSVTAVGQGTLRYQWQTGGVSLGSATRSSLTLSNVKLSQAGLYSVSVTNSFGAITGSATLGVVPFFITNQPQNLTTYAGGPANFSVATAGNGPYGYQWQHYNTNLPSATNNPLVLSNLQYADAGSYSVTVTNAFGPVQSSNAVLTVLPILVTGEPQSQGGFLDQTITFAVTAQAAPALNYQWLFNGAVLPGATSSALTLTNCQYGQSGTCQALINTVLSATNSAEATLTVAQVASWGTQGQGCVPASLSNLLAITAHTVHALAIKADRTVARWGDTRPNPAGLSNVNALAAGASHDLALLDDGSVVAWGDNYLGQTTLPNDLTNALAIAAGGYHSLALKPDATVAAWGENTYGQISVPPGLTNIISIAAGGDHNLALRADGTVVAWGYNGNNQTNVPPGLSNVVAIAAGDLSSLALTADGRVVVWGDASYGEQNVPASATNVVAIASGFNHCLALKADGTVLAWGDPFYGEATVPVGLRNVIGIAASDDTSLALVGDGTPGPTALLRNPAWTPTGFSVSLPTRSKKVYLLEYKNSPADSNWIALPLVAGTGRVITLIDPSASGSQRFYRVRSW